MLAYIGEHVAVLQKIERLRERGKEGEQIVVVSDEIGRVLSIG